MIQSMRGVLVRIGPQQLNDAVECYKKVTEGSIWYIHLDMGIARFTLPNNTEIVLHCDADFTNTLPFVVEPLDETLLERLRAAGFVVRVFKEPRSFGKAWLVTDIWNNRFAVLDGNSQPVAPRTAEDTVLDTTPCPAA